MNPVTIDYDAVGRRTRLTLPNQVSTEYHYNTASRLTALIYRTSPGLLGDLTYVYDPVASATYDAANRQCTFGDKTRTCDANGNLTSVSEPSRVTTLTWDARNRLTSVTGPNLSWAFGYDGFGRRAQKTINTRRSDFR